MENICCDSPVQLGVEFEFPGEEVNRFLCLFWTKVEDRLTQHPIVLLPCEETLGQEVARVKAVLS